MYFYILNIDILEMFWVWVRIKFYEYFRVYFYENETHLLICLGL